MYIRLLTATWFVLFIAAHASENSDYSDLQNYLGSYQFPDGTVVTGGRMDEAGKVMLSYLDVKAAEHVAIFDAESANLAGLYGTQVSIAFEDNGNVMIWKFPDKEPVRLQKIMTPQTRPANFNNGDIALSGTLHLPPNKSGNAPAVVLAHGSGPTNRHLGPWITFFVEQGFATLAFDKRGTGESDGDWQQSNYQDLSNDLIAAARWLAQQKEIDESRIGLKTSSQSGWYGPHTLRQSELFSFLIQRAGPAVNIGVGTAHEIEQEFKAKEIAASSIQPAIAFWLELHEMAQAGANLSAANQFLQEAKAQPWFERTFGEWEQITPLWWSQHRANMKLQPALTTASLDQPVLWFLAEHDENVPYESSMQALEQAQKSHPDLTVVTIHDAGHSFFINNADGEVRYTDEYWEAMADWLEENVFQDAHQTKH